MRPMRPAAERLCSEQRGTESDRITAAWLWEGSPLFGRPFVTGEISPTLFWEAPARSLLWDLAVASNTSTILTMLEVSQVYTT